MRRRSRHRNSTAQHENHLIDRLYGRRSHASTTRRSGCSPDRRVETDAADPHRRRLKRLRRCAERVDPRDDASRGDAGEIEGYRDAPRLFVFRERLVDICAVPDREPVTSSEYLLPGRAGGAHREQDVVRRCVIDPVDPHRLQPGDSRGPLRTRGSDGPDRAGVFPVQNAPISILSSKVAPMRLPALVVRKERPRIVTKRYGRRDIAGPRGNVNAGDNGAET